MAVGPTGHMPRPPAAEYHTHSHNDDIGKSEGWVVNCTYGTRLSSRLAPTVSSV